MAAGADPHSGKRSRIDRVLAVKGDLMRIVKIPGDRFRPGRIAAHEDVSSHIPFAGLQMKFLCW